MKSDQTNLLKILEERARNTPSKTAITFAEGDKNGASRTYAELWRRIANRAALFQAYGHEGDRVLLLFTPGLEFVESFLACLLAGRVAVPAAVPTNARAMQRTAGIMRNAGTSLVSTETNLMVPIRKALKGFGDSPTVLAVDQADVPGNVQPDPCRIRSEAVAFLQYTSGATGNPKGVVVSHGSLFDNLGRIYDGFAFDESTRVASWLPVHHDMGLIGAVLAPLYGGVPTVLMSPLEFVKSPARWLQLISRTRTTMSGGPNFGYDMCVNRTKPEQLEQVDLSCWTVAFNGAEPIRESTIRRFAEKFGRYGFRAEAVFPCYGLAEATLMVTCKEVPGAGTKTVPLDRSDSDVGEVGTAEDNNRRARVLVSSGTPNPDHEVLIVDPETTRACPPGEVGEIWVSGPSVCLGYWGRVAETRTTFEATLRERPGQRFLRTGDLGFVQDGELFVSGRLKNIVIIRGTCSSCEDIEEVAQASHPALHGSVAAAFSVDLDDQEQLVVVQEVGRHITEPIDSHELSEAIQESIIANLGFGAAEIALVPPGRLPRTTSGKVQRSTTRELHAAGELPYLVGRIDLPVKRRERA